MILCYALLPSPLNTTSCSTYFLPFILYDTSACSSPCHISRFLVMHSFSSYPHASPLEKITVFSVVHVQRIFIYLKGTINYGLWYPRNHNFQLSVYLDVDWANYMYERKSTSGGAFFLGDSLVAWLSKKQGSISLSTTEA
jgi:hypothetical protein